MPRHALAKHDLARLIHAHRVKHVLCDIDPEDVHLLLHWTRLLWLHGFTALELMVAHCSRSAQGRVHFITTELFTAATIWRSMPFHSTLPWFWTITPTATGLNAYKEKEQH